MVAVQESRRAIHYTTRGPNAESNSRTLHHRDSSPNTVTGREIKERELRAGI